MDGDCAEKLRLLRAWSFANSDYSRAVLVLHTYSGVMRRSEYDRLHRYTEAARKFAADASEALESHVAEHGC